MADVDMTDAPSASAVKKTKGGDAEAKGDGKKRFEVKKVRPRRSVATSAP